jgi:two-component system, chemotaxis family, response regulator Rcp1
MSRSVNQEPLEILLVEDNLGDIRLAQEIFRECDVPNHLSIARDGVEALARLRGEGPYTAAPQPALMLLDLNLPRKDGRELLAEVKADPALRQIPIVIFSTSSADRDILKCYDLHANCYVTKPIQLEEFLAVVELVKRFWLQTVKLPTQGG